jgi:hypothetical protein
MTSQRNGHPDGILALQSVTIYSPFNKLIMYIIGFDFSLTHPYSDFSRWNVLMTFDIVLTGEWSGCLGFSIDGRMFPGLKVFPIVTSSILGIPRFYRLSVLVSCVKNFQLQNCNNIKDTYASVSCTLNKNMFYGSGYMNFNVPLSAVEGTERQIRHDDGIKW